MGKRKSKRRRKIHRMQQKAELIWFTCSECERHKVKAYDVVKSVVCAYCIQKMAGNPKTPAYLKKGQGKPRGWHFRKFFEYEGIVYSYGEEITDKKEIKKLRTEHKKKEKKKKSSGKTTSKKRKSK